MASRALHSRRAVLAALLAVSTSAAADEPPPPAAPRPPPPGTPPPAPPSPSPSSSASAAPPPPPPDDLCDPAAVAWARRATQQSGVDITAVSCPGGLVRFKVRDAGCDYEVTKGKGFQRTADGAYAVSPIVNLEWASAPEPMKKGLATLMAALTKDPTLPITGVTRRAPPAKAGPDQARQDKLAIGAAFLITAGALGFWWTRGSGPAAPPPAS